MLDEDIVFVQIAGQLPRHEALRRRPPRCNPVRRRGKTDPKLEVTLPIDSAVPVELGEGVKLTVGRHGPSVMFLLKRPSNELTKFRTLPSLIAELVDDIRRERIPN